jgi:hypothetical protein
MIETVKINKKRLPSSRDCLGGVGTLAKIGLFE